MNSGPNEVGAVMDLFQTVAIIANTAVLVYIVLRFGASKNLSAVLKDGREFRQPRRVRPCLATARDVRAGAGMTSEALIPSDAHRDPALRAYRRQAEQRKGRSDPCLWRLARSDRFNGLKTPGVSRG